MGQKDGAEGHLPFLGRGVPLCHRSVDPSLSTCEPTAPRLQDPPLCPFPHFSLRGFGIARFERPPPKCSGRGNLERYQIHARSFQSQYFCNSLSLSPSIHEKIAATKASQTNPQAWFELASASMRNETSRTPIDEPPFLQAFGRTLIVRHRNKLEGKVWV